MKFLKALGKERITVAFFDKISLISFYDSGRDYSNKPVCPYLILTF